jgi:protein pelota
MLYKQLGARKGIVLIPEDSMDLWILRRIIKKGDDVEAWTTREIKQQGEFVRPDKGRRIRVKIRLSVEQLSFDNELGRLRIRGIITGTNDESVSKGVYHSIEVVPSTEIILLREITPDQIRIISRSQYKSFVIISLDSREAGIGILKGLSFSYLGTIRSDVSGKLFQQDYSKHMSQYINNILETVLEVIKKNPDSEIIILGPGQTKNQLANKLQETTKQLQVIDGFDVTGEDGAKIAVNDTRLKSILKGTEYEYAQSVLEEAKIRLARNDNRIAMGFSACRIAVKEKAVEALLLADELFKTVNEEQIVELANDAERQGAKVILVDSSTFLGVQIGKMGGSVATLRYPVDFR